MRRADRDPRLAVRGPRVERVEPRVHETHHVQGDDRVAQKLQDAGIEPLPDVGIRSEIGSVEDGQERLRDGHVGATAEEEQGDADDRRQSRVELQTEVEGAQHIGGGDRMVAEEEKEHQPEQRERHQVDCE